VSAIVFFKTLAGRKSFSLAGLLAASQALRFCPFGGRFIAIRRVSWSATWLA
jgi:hypothetical protein